MLIRKCNVHLSSSLFSPLSFLHFTLPFLSCLHSHSLLFSSLLCHCCYLVSVTCPSVLISLFSCLSFLHLTLPFLSCLHSHSLLFSVLLNGCCIFFLSLCIFPALSPLGFHVVFSLLVFLEHQTVPSVVLLCKSVNYLAMVQLNQ